MSDSDETNSNCPQGKAPADTDASTCGAFSFQTNMMTIETITPELAKEYLKQNDGNRPIQKRVVEKYATDMSLNKWMVSTQGIGFDINGRLVDGQHRLLACIKSNKPFVTMVARGLQPEVFKVIDIHFKRTGGQIAGIAGVKNSNNMMACLNAVLMFKECAGKETISHSAIMKYSDATRLDILLADIDSFDASCKAARSAYDKCRVLNQAAMSGIHYIASKVHPEMADSFVDGLGSGLGMEENDPRLALRNRMIDRAAKIHKERFEWIMVLHIYAWNAFIKGRSLKKLVWRADDVVPHIVL